MRARIVVFPIKGRTWCFARSLDPLSGSHPSPSLPSPSWKDLWTTIRSGQRPASENAEIVVDFVADKMNRGWSALEKAPPGTIKSKIHRFFLKLLSQVKPSEIFLKSVSKDITKLEITYPTSLNPRLVRRRLRHVAVRGSAIHKKYFYGSLSLIPVTSVFSVLPLPNIPFFWTLFRGYSNWRALQGSERLLLLASDSPSLWSSLATKGDTTKTAAHSPLVLRPSDDLEKVLDIDDNEYTVSNEAISKICERYHLDKNEVMKHWRSSS
ncbi:DNA helicase protein [Dioscorea alata]|uniref:DNA helicase protein n=1 Tax=Dioscorea alata TaxID=55571 RepID=A0ACB7U4T3_DIOAL|nr:DNA helicase protein [Dioscorea alata]